MTSLSLSTGLTLTAAAADDSRPPRTAEGILVPYGEPGRTSLGLKTVRRGALQFTADSVQPGSIKLVGTYGHNNEAAVSRLVEHQDRPEGLWGRLRIAETPAGDLLLAEIRDGVRDGLSVELSALTFDPADPDVVTSARLDFVAHVPVGAFDSARVHALAAALPDPLNGETVTTPVLEPAQPAATPAAAPALDAAGLQQLLAGLQALQAAAHVAPSSEPSAAALLGVNGLPVAPSSSSSSDPIMEAATLAAALHQGAGDERQLLAALQDVTASNLPLLQQGSSRLGDKLWEGASYSRQFVQLMRQKPLTSLTYYGWEFTELPKVQPWAGDKQPISGNPVSVRQVPFTAQRCAGGWDVDRAYKDFAQPDFWAEFYAAQTESYQELSDQWAAEAIAANALDVSNDANLATLPADFADLVAATGVEAGPTQLLRAAAIGRVILQNTPRVKQGPDYILVHPLDWLQLSELTSLDLPAFLQLLKVDPNNFLPTIQVERGNVVLGVRNGMEFRELGNGSPIRVEALDVARGGVDSAVYGYVGISLQRAGSVISVPLAAAA